MRNDSTGLGSLAHPSLDASCVISVIDRGVNVDLYFVSLNFLPSFLRFLLNLLFWRIVKLDHELISLK